MHFMPKGDPFAPRNPYATKKCFEELPPLRAVKEDELDHITRAWYELPQLAS